MRIGRGILAAAVLGLGLGVARGDIIELRDGRKITGSMSREGSSMVIKATDGSTVVVSPDDVVRVTLTSDLSPAEAATSEWNRVQVQIKRADDLATIIDLHRKFLEKYPDLPVSVEVKKALAAYESLAKSDPVKFRGRWMARAQVEVTLKEWTEQAKPAVDAYKGGDMKGALDAVKKILEKDESNPDAITIGGLAAYRAGNLNLAQTYFTSLGTADPSSVLAENNLAVVTFQRKLQPEALLHYTKALQADFSNRLVLDNIAEAMNSYTGDKNGTPYKTLQKAYDQAETKMEAVMAKEGLARYGSTWVTPEMATRLKANQQAIQDQMSQLDAQYQLALQSLASMDGQIQQYQTDINGYTSSLVVYDSQINIVGSRGGDISLLAAEWEMASNNLLHTQQQLGVVQAQRNQTASHMSAFKDQAAALKARLAAAVSPYTGVQRIMELGEAEKPPPPTAISDPATQPALPNAPVVLPTPAPLPPSQQQIQVQPNFTQQIHH